MRIPLRLWLIPFAVLVPKAALPADEMAVSAIVLNGYSRERLPDGMLKPEFYVFGEGGRWSRPINDPGMDQLTIATIVRIIAIPLAQQNYRPAPKPADASLLIVVFWGSTEGSKAEGPAGVYRDMLDARNARSVRLPSGMYFYHLETTSGSVTRRFAILE